MIKEIALPDLGEGIEQVDVSEVLVKVGDHLKAEDPIIVLESEKATMEIPTPYAGTVKEIRVEAGASIRPGQTLLMLEIEAAETGQKTETPVEDKAAETRPLVADVKPEKTEKAAPTPPAITAKSPPLASPGVRRFARELGADLQRVPGTGPKNRITREDVQSYIKSVLATADTPRSAPALPVIDFSQWGPVEAVELSKIKRITGERLQGAWQTIPHVTQFDEADITELENFRKTLKALNRNESTKVSLLPFLMKAVSQVLAEMPEFNSSLDSTGSRLVYKKYYHIGVAVDTPNGLVVPVIRDVDTKGYADLSEELASLSRKAREKKLLPDEMKGGCFTISSLGGISGTGFTPIVNPPEVAILGVSRTKIAPVFRDDEFIPRTILPFSLSYDHRVIDGAQAARFTRRLGELLTGFSDLKGLDLT